MNWNDNPWRRDRVLTEEQANQVYDILVEECGAPDATGSAWSQRESFIMNQTGAVRSIPHEWRFCGALGFGGKFWNDSEKFRVSCYQEDETDERRAMMDKANERLQALYLEWFTPATEASAEREAGDHHWGDDYDWSD